MSEEAMEVFIQKFRRTDFKYIYGYTNSIVLFAKAKKDKEKGIKYVFETQTNGENTCKTPKGMFLENEIPNDLNLVRTAIIDYEN